MKVERWIERNPLKFWSAPPPWKMRQSHSLRQAQSYWSCIRLRCTTIHRSRWDCYNGLQPLLLLQEQGNQSSRGHDLPTVAARVRHRGGKIEGHMQREVVRQSELPFLVMPFNVYVCCCVRIVASRGGGGQHSLKYVYTSIKHAHTRALTGCRRAAVPSPHRHEPFNTPHNRTANDQ